MTERLRFTLLGAMSLGVLGGTLMLGGRFEAPLVLFWVVMIAASLCVVFAVGLSVVAHRNDQAELGLVALFFTVVSVLSVVHGITTPGVIYGANAATMTSAALAVPFAVVALTPSLLRNTRLAPLVARCWRMWVATYSSITIAIGAWLLAAPSATFGLEPGSTTWKVVAVAAAVGCALAGRRHAWLADVAGRPGPLFIAYAFLLLAFAASGVGWVEPWAVPFWIVHAADITGVLAATVGGIFVYRSHGTLSPVIAPLTAVDPHAALELGLDPVVHRFVADLEQKDRQTRDHVVRTAGLAVSVAVELGLDGPTVRAAGMVGLLHDVGKLEIPDEILTKQDKLTDEEFDVMRTHAALGAQLVRESMVLAPIAGAVGAHHERIDGGGYPAGLSGNAIPIEARIVSVCDAYDAMSRTRHYRGAMANNKVRSILSENAGTQWDVTTVAALETVLDTQVVDDAQFEQVGKSATVEFACGDCVPAMLDDWATAPAG